MATEYRIVVRQFEYERMLAGNARTRQYLGARYADPLLERVFATNASKLDLLFPKFPVAHQTLYAINAFVGEVCNGGISQFLYNAPSVLRQAVPLALRRIGDREVLSRSRPLFETYERNAALASIRQQPTSWNGYLEFTSELGEEAKRFDAWFYDGQEGELDRRMRLFVGQHKEQFIIVCDGDMRLEAEWTRRILSRWLQEYRGCCRDENRRLLALYEHLFIPSVRDGLGESDLTRRANAKVAAELCVATVEHALRSPRRATFQLDPVPQIRISGKGWFRSTIPVTIQYYDTDLSLLWHIASWGEARAGI